MSTASSHQVSCPVCGSTNLIKQTERRQIGDRFTGFLEIEEFIYQCQDCHQKGDFAHQNDDIYKNALKELSKQAMPKMLNELTENGISMAHFERCFDLPQRTTARWKREGASAAAMALMKTVITYPWLSEVAEKNFELNEATSILMQQGVGAIQKSFDAFNKNPLDFSLLSSPKSMSTYYVDLKSSILSPPKSGSFTPASWPYTQVDLSSLGIIQVSSAENNELAKAS